MLYKNNKILMPFKGDYKPVNIYKGSEKISGWEEKTFTGTDLNIHDTYNDDFKSLVLSGRYSQATPTIESPVNPIFSGDCTLYAGDSEIYIPTLRAVDNFADSYDILTGVRTNRIIEQVITGNTWWGTDGVGDRRTDYFYAYSEETQPFNHFLCNMLDYMPWSPSEDKEGITSYTRVYVVFLKSRLGILETDTASQRLTKLKNYFGALYSAGTPFVVWYARKTPTTTQLTPQAPKALPYLTQVYDGGDLATDKTAEVKVFGRD